MDIRMLTGFVAHALLGLYWLWVVSSTAPRLRRSSRDRGLRWRVFLIKTAAVVMTSLVVGVIHFWATRWWHVVVAMVLAIVLGVALRRAYRGLVAAPRHRATLAQRAHWSEHRFPVPRGDQELPRRSHAAVPQRRAPT